MTIINEENKNRELKERIRMMNSLRDDFEKNNLIEESKKQTLTKLLRAIKLLVTFKTVNTK